MVGIGGVMVGLMPRLQTLSKIWPGKSLLGPKLSQLMHLLSFVSLGTGHVTKSDEFSEKFQTAFDTPPSFSESYIALFATKL